MAADRVRRIEEGRESERVRRKREGGGQEGGRDDKREDKREEERENEFKRSSSMP